MKRTRSDAEKKAIGKGLQQARKAAGMTQADLSKAVKVGQSVISDWERGELESWVEYIDALAGAFRIDPEQLHSLSRIGPELLDNWTPEADLPPVRDGSDLPAVIEIPEYEVKLSAGAGFFVDNEQPIGQWPFSRRYLLDELGLHAGSLAVVQVQGDSMEPTLKSGDRVLIDRADIDAGAEGVFAIWNSLATVVKRVEVVQPVGDPVKLRLISDNKAHSQYEVPVDQLYVIGRVVWFARRF